MKTLILYATKYGATGEVARRIADRIEDAAVYDLKQNDIPPVAGFDRVIIGSPVYAGTIRKEVKAFVSQNADALHGKAVGLFLAGLSPERGKACFDANFPPDVLQSAKATGCLGGIFDPKKAGAMERFIMKMVARQSGYTDTIDDNKIEQFVEAMNAC